jgi:hypothetical protein
VREKPKIPLKVKAYSSQISLSHRNKNKSTFIVQKAVNQTAESSQISTQRDFLKNEVPSMTSTVLSELMNEMRSKRSLAR